MSLRTYRRAALLGATLVLGAAAMQEPGPGASLGQLEAGQWELRGQGNTLIASICLGDPAQLVQPEHGSSLCPRTIVGSDARSVTFRYTCPGAGAGRTTVLIETPRLARIDSQGIHNGVPFAVRAEARRIAPCH
jgi:hypothetical protein